MTLSPKTHIVADSIAFVVLVRSAMSTPFLVSIDSSESLSGLSIAQISYFGRVLIKASSREQAELFLRQNFRQLDVYVDASAILSVGDVVDILNAGAAKVFISLEQLIVLSKEQTVPASRLVVIVTSGAQIETFKGWVAENAERKDAGLCCTQFVEVQTALKTLGLNPEAGNIFQIYHGDSIVLENIQQGIEQGAIAVVSSSLLTIERQLDGKISAAKLISSRAVPDPNTGLYATSVTDEQGTCLGLVWSSNESIAEALRTGSGVYQSRKRGLWYKGQSSGDTQELLRLGFDCDRDCLLFVVKQIGRGE